MRRIKYKKGRKVNSNLFEYTGIHHQDPVALQLVVFDEQTVTEKINIDLNKLQTVLNNKEYSDKVIWLNIHGLHNTTLIQNLGEILELPLTIIGDILNVSRRSKMEEFDDILFFSIKSVLQDHQQNFTRIEQISFILKDNIIISFQEKKNQFFEHIRERIKSNSGPVRKKTNDYLLYLLLDAVMENFYISIENNEIIIEELLTLAKTSYKADFHENIEKERENINLIKRAVIPLREALFNLKSIQNDDDFSGIQKSNFTYFSRLHQKCLELLEQIDYDIATLESASNIFFSSQNQRMNQIMKTLTIVSAIFMPLTFIAGVYGMNFKNIPELENPNGYYYSLIAMLVISVLMIIYFKIKKWF